MGLITPATVVDDSPQELNGKPWPVNVTPTYGGLTTVLHGVTQSLNTVAVRVLEQVTPGVLRFHGKPLRHHLHGALF